ncbi:MAG TPA: methylmalonyl-CoA mutase family protein, partial [Acidimicrobiales bacterium]
MDDAARERAVRQAFGLATAHAGARTTLSGTPLDVVYGSPPHPGEYPYTRGIHATMYRSRLWTMRMFAGFGTARDTNARFHELLRAGGTGLSTAFDMPTLMGRDSDHPSSRGEVGRAGVAVDTLDDMDDLFAG